MHQRSKVSLAGRLIVTAIFVLTILIPEVIVVILLCAHPGRGEALAGSLVRFMLACIVYYFIMAGYGWARWIMAFLLMMSVAMVVADTGKHLPLFAIIVGILFIPSIVILLGLKIIRPEERIRVRRHRSSGKEHSTANTQHSTSKSG